MLKVLVLILGILCIYFIFKYINLKKEIMSCHDQIKYIQENNSSMRISSSLHYEPLSKMIELFENQREENKSLYAKHMHQEETIKELISNISHDIRTPLTSIRGYVEMLESANKSEQAQYISIITKRLNDMEIMLDSFFLYTKLQTQNKPFVLEKQPVYPLLCDVLLSYYPQLSKIGLEPKIVCEDEGLEGYINEDQMRRVFQNLLMNVIRYGRMPFQIELFRKGNDILCVFSNAVNDEHIDVEHIFDRFYQADHSRGNDGSGLGMAIVKDLCEKMNVAIEAKLECGIISFVMKIREWEDV